MNLNHRPDHLNAPTLLQFVFFLLFLIGMVPPAHSQTPHSVARQWNEVLLQAIRKDFARPTVHARNLFHASVAMYDAWAAYDPQAKPYFLGDTLGGISCSFTGVPVPTDIEAARNEAISYAAYRMLQHRFQNSPGAAISQPLFDSLFLEMGYNPNNYNMNYASGSPAELGNYIADCLISFGFQDGANELGNYGNTHYLPTNPTLIPVVPGNLTINDPNRWQPLTLSIFIDQSGNVYPINTPKFLSPEWGDVVPFAMDTSNRVAYTRNGDTYWVYRDPGSPPLIDTLTAGGHTDDYQWNFALVSAWSSHLDPTDSVMWDISPASIGNIQSYPTEIDSLPNFYNLQDGGDYGIGHAINPVTGQPYAPQIVPRGDYARVLAEFWADGPESETPPGHWFTILNYVNDHPLFERRWEGSGPVIDLLEWDVKAYLTLAGAVHDAAIAAWSIKGWYDYLRPISAIRYMADRGQCTDTTLSNYSPIGIPLMPGLIEVVDSTDALAGGAFQHVGKIKVNAWRGPDYVINPATDDAGVGWILAENWWPYQRPSFVTPPFAGYISGHSTFSRAAAEVMTLLTGDAFFPGGMGEFVAHQDSFLVFEEGPSQDVILQWATYRDASDQCSLSRIWGGIHPPADDIPGRLIGRTIGIEAFHFAETYFDPNQQADVVSMTAEPAVVDGATADTAGFALTISYDRNMDNLATPLLSFPVENPLNTLAFNADSSGWLNAYTYRARYDVLNSNESLDNIDVQVVGALDEAGQAQAIFAAQDVFDIDRIAPTFTSLSSNRLLLADADTGMATFRMELLFDAEMDTSTAPTLAFPQENPLAQSLSLRPDSSRWLNAFTYQAAYDLADAGETLSNIDVQITGALGQNARPQVPYLLTDYFSIDTENPAIALVSTNRDTLRFSDAGPATFTISLLFSEPVDTTLSPTLSFPNEDPLAVSLQFNTAQSSWLDALHYAARYDLSDAASSLPDVDVEIGGDLRDLAGNLLVPTLSEDLFSIDVQASTGIGEAIASGSFLLFPNPVSQGEPLQVSVPDGSWISEWELLHLNGQVLQQQTGHTTTLVLDTRPLSPGVYLLRVQMGDATAYGKVVVQP